MKMIKARLRNLLSDNNLVQLMRIAIEGPDPEHVDFDNILDILSSQIDESIFNIVVFVYLALHINLFSIF